MASPFPGMDPYLEDSLWREVHTYLMTAIANDLNARLPEAYRATVEQATYIATTGIGTPDVIILGDSSEPKAQVTGVLASVVAPVQVEVPEPEEVIERWLEVRQIATNQVITSIEILSPTNKVDPRGREQYERKRNRVLASRTHLVEIDLIRSGKPFPILYMPASRYRILISRSSTRPGAQLYPFNLPHPIPAIPVPLLSEDEELLLDLQTILNTIYDQGRYRLAIDYSQVPPPPVLTQEEQDWMRQILESGR
ncbi:hypothetical protein BST81_16660 [Leptolyngbya sp. 'hensonii']|uniref:DUF4058 family protein n=1 Tax=Leptolyngbya sp. 'hensonii' TaxID=1922337 RepID=UPI00094FF2B4|nr:DUF4058 family protein [Leptolyngbya sp. 'hensonii']OLP17488.1 hypothetical protein BST81_16660 [Leptolyngbya sp. 'hensonii']